MITAIPGVRVGHWSDEPARTGCTVVLLPSGTVASGEVRGGAPGTREWALLDPRRTVDRVDAVVLTGGSAFGLAACDGVVTWCEERGIGWPTAAGPVPIVVGMVIYDLSVGDPCVRPGAREGYAACEAALSGAAATCRGGVGAGTGAMIGMWRGVGAARPAGLGSAVARSGDLSVAALVALNALGDPLSSDIPRPRLPGVPNAVEATSIGLVVTNAAVDKPGCRLMAEAGHDGLARALDPVHTPADGDALVAAATGGVPASPYEVRALSAWAVEQAVADAARSPGEPGSTREWAGS